MGTNYYLIENVCECCGRHDTVHVTKSFSTWHGTFVEDDAFAPHPEVDSVNKWLKRIEDAVAAGGRVESEYGQVYSPDEFRARAYARSRGERRRSFDEMKNPRYSARFEKEPGGYWLDPEGFPFYGGEFS